MEITLSGSLQTNALRVAKKATFRIPTAVFDVTAGASGVTALTTAVWVRRSAFSGSGHSITHPVGSQRQIVSWNRRILIDRSGLLGCCFWGRWTSSPLSVGCLCIASWVTEHDMDRSRAAETSLLGLLDIIPSAGMRGICIAGSRPLGGSVPRYVCLIARNTTRLLGTGGATDSQSWQAAATYLFLCS